MLIFNRLPRRETPPTPNIGRCFIGHFFERSPNKTRFFLWVQSSFFSTIYKAPRRSRFFDCACLACFARHEYHLICLNIPACGAYWGWGFPGLNVTYVCQYLTFTPGCVERVLRGALCLAALCAWRRFVPGCARATPHNLPSALELALEARTNRVGSAIQTRK
jgi:hypothetical protein